MTMNDEADYAAEFEQFYSAHILELTDFLRNGKRLGELAEEAADDAMMIVRAKWPVQRKRSPRDQKSYLYRVAINKGHEKRAADKRASGTELASRTDWADPSKSKPPPTPEGTAVSRSNFEELLTKLPPQQMLMVALRSCGCSVDEIADIMGVTKGTVTSTLAAAYKNLRNLLNQEDY